MFAFLLVFFSWKKTHLPSPVVFKLFVISSDEEAPPAKKMPKREVNEPTSQPSQPSQSSTNVSQPVAAVVDVEAIQKTVRDEMQRGFKDDQDSIN